MTKQIIIKDWSDFTAQVQRDHSRGWIFRGVRIESYELRPKIGRGRYTTDLEVALLTEFRRAALPHIPLRLDDESMDWQTIAQHHGLPTRLLDWTESPYVATFFAVREPAERKAEYFDAPKDILSTDGSRISATGMVTLTTLPGAIYAVHVDDTDPYGATQNPKDFAAIEASMRRPKLIIPPHITPRVTAQRAILTAHFDPTKTWEPSSLVKYIIRADLFDEFKAALDLVGINEASMFPDLDGLSRYLGWRYIERG